MPTLDVPFPLNGLVYRMLELAERWAPDLVAQYSDNVAIALSSAIGVRAKAFVAINAMPCNAEVLLIGVPGSGKSTTINLVRMLNRDIVLKSGTPEYIEDVISESVSYNGFLEGIICSEEFAKTIKHRERGKYLADMYYLLKQMYDCSYLESGRVAVKSRFVPEYSYMVNFYMGMTYSDYADVSDYVDEAFIRRVLVLEYRERLNKRGIARNAAGLDRIREMLSDLSRYHVKVNIDDNLVGHVKYALDEIDAEARKISYSCADACCDYFWKIMAWRAIDRAYTHGKMEESDSFFYLATQYLASKFVPCDVWVIREDIEAAKQIIMFNIMENYKFFSMITDPDFVKIWNRLSHMLENHGVIEVKKLSRYLRVKYRTLEEVLKSCLALGLIEVYDENGDRVESPSELDSMYGRWKIALPGRAKVRVVDEKEVYSQLRSIKRMPIDKIDVTNRDLISALIKLLRDERIWLVERGRGKMYISAYLGDIATAMKNNMPYYTGPEAIKIFRKLIS